MSTLIAFNLLGPIEVVVDGASPPPAALWRKHLALALYLAVNRERPISRDRLLGLLWPESPESAARHSLNEALRVIRLAYGRAMIASTSESVQWVGAVALDVEMFSRVVDDDEPAAASLIRGTWCEGFAVPGAGEFEEWLALERDRWRGRLTATLSRVAGLLADRGDLANAVWHSNLAHEINPWDDEAIRTVMRIRTLMGDRAGAIAAGRAHADRLASELRAVPAAATRALLARLAEGAEGEQEASGRGRDRSAQPPLLRRAVVLEEGLDRWREATAAGHGTMICWLGPAGSGRSRILLESTERLRLEGAHIAMVHTVPADGASRDAGLHAIADAIVANLDGLGGADPSAVGTLATLRPRWAERFRTPAVHALEYVDALVMVLAAAAEDAPVVIAIDDLDRMDAGTIGAITAMVRALRDQPVSFFITAPSGSDQGAVYDAIRLPGTSIPGAVLLLPPLDEAHLRALVAWSQPDWDDASRDRLVRRLRTEAGESLFIAVELLGAIRVGLTLPDAPGVWPPPERTLDATLPATMPTPLLMALRHTWQQFDDPERQLLQAIALGTEPVTERHLAQWCEDIERLEPPLDRLEELQWLISDHSGYRFASRALRRFVAEDTMTPGQRRRVEARVGGT